MIIYTLGDATRPAAAGKRRCMIFMVLYFIVLAFSFLARVTTQIHRWSGTRLIYLLAIKYWGKA